MAATLQILPPSVAKANAAAVAAASAPGKRAAGLADLQSAIGSGYRFRAFRNSVKVLEVSYASTLPIASNRFELPLSFASTLTLLTADVSTGTWYGEITKADGSVQIRGALTTTSGAGPFKLSDSLTEGGSLTAGAIYIAYPATIDGASTYPPIPPRADEQLVLLSSPKAFGAEGVAINQHWFPWNPTYPLPAADTYTYSWWHGGWYDTSPTVDLGFGSIGVYEGTAGTMLQFMIKNPTKQSGRTDADYNWVQFDQWIAAHKALGKKVCFHAYVNMSGATATWGQNPWQIPYITPVVYRHALESALSRAGNTIAFVEMANEPPPSLFGGGWSDNWFQEWQGSAALFRAQHALTAQIIANMGHGAKVLGPTWLNVDVANVLANFADGEVASAGLNAGLGALSGKVADYLYGIGIHGYSINWATHRAGMNTARSVLSQMGKPNMPIIQSEWLSFVGTWGVDFRQGTVDEDYQQWLNRYIYDRATGVEIATHFTWNQPGQYYGDDWSQGAAKRARWETDMRFMHSMEWGRVALLNDNRMRVTLVDGRSLESTTGI